MARLRRKYNSIYNIINRHANSHALSIAIKRLSHARMEYKDLKQRYHNPEISNYMRIVIKQEMVSVDREMCIQETMVRQLTGMTDIK